MISYIQLLAIEQGYRSWVVTSKQYLAQCTTRDHMSECMHMSDKTLAVVKENLTIYESRLELLEPYRGRIHRLEVSNQSELDTSEDNYYNVG